MPAAHSDGASTPLRVLVVDDDEQVFALIEAVVTQVGDRAAELRWAKNGDEAASALAEGKTDVTLFDLHLGRESGLDVLAAARTAGWDGPALILTGDDREGVEEEGRAHGAHSVVAKDRVMDGGLAEAIASAVAS